MQMGKLRPKARKLFSAIPNTPLFAEDLLCFRPYARFVGGGRRCGYGEEISSHGAALQLRERTIEPKTDQAH